MCFKGRALDDDTVTLPAAGLSENDTVVVVGRLAHTEEQAVFVSEHRPPACGGVLPYNDPTQLTDPPFHCLMMTTRTRRKSKNSQNSRCDPVSGILSGPSLSAGSS